MKILFRFYFICAFDLQLRSSVSVSAEELSGCLTIQPLHANLSPLGLSSTSSSYPGTVGTDSSQHGVKVVISKIFPFRALWRHLWRKSGKCVQTVSRSIGDVGPPAVVCVNGGYSVYSRRDRKKQYVTSSDALWLATQSVISQIYCKCNLRAFSISGPQAQSPLC